MHEHPEDRRGEAEREPVDVRRRGGKVAVLVVLAVVILVFVLQNRDRANVDFLFWDLDVRIWFALAVAVILGSVTGFVVGRTWRRPRSG
jgi:uncharacterized integral membrane protein